ncbi:MAG: glycosyltransferase family 39 protein [Flavobacteriales bacterium]
MDATPGSSDNGASGPRWWPTWLDRHPRRALLLIVGIALCFCVARYMTERPDLEDGQTEHYWPLANHLLDGEGYSLCDPLYFPLCGPGNDASAMREPLPTFLFAAVAFLTGRSFPLTVGTEMLLYLATLLVIFGFVRWWLGTRAALLSAFIWAFYLPAMKLINQLSGDLAGALLFTACAWAFMHALRSGRTMHWVVTGALLGLGILSRSALILAALPWTVAAIMQGWRASRSVRPLVAFGAALAIVLSPWVLRNHHVFGRYLVGTSMNGYNLFRNNHQLASENYFRYVDFLEGDTVVDELVARRTDLPHVLNEAAMDTVYLHEGLRNLKAHPGRYVALSIWRLIPLWTNWGVNQAYHKPIDAIDYLVVVQQVVLLLLFLIGLRHMDRSLWPVLVAILLQVMAYAGLVAQVRYVVPIMPVVIAVAAAALLRLASGKGRSVAVS